MPNNPNQRGSHRPNEKKPTPPEQKCFLPKDTLDLVDDCKSEIDNYALYLERLANQVFKQGESEDKKKFRFFYDSKSGKNDHPVLQKIPGMFSKPEVKVKELLNTLKQRQTAHLQALCGNLTQKGVFKPDWRVIVGLGGASVYETAITLHHVYGIPYIPASAIKGITRAYWIQENYGYDKHAEDKAQQQEYEYFCAAFGGLKCKDKQGKEGAQAGKVIFFDAFPLELKESSIQADIMNPHYPDYYRNNDIWPTDTQNPNPIHFLTVANTPFRFAVGCSPDTDNAKALLEKTYGYLCMALTERGIGAKTAVGYGRFGYDERKTKSLADDQEEQKEALLPEEAKALKKLQELLEEFNATKNDRLKSTLTSQLSETFKQAATWDQDYRNQFADFAETAYQQLGWGSSNKKQEKKDKIAQLREDKH